MSGPGAPPKKEKRQIPSAIATLNRNVWIEKKPKNFFKYLKICRMLQFDFILNFFLY